MRSVKTAVAFLALCLSACSPESQASKAIASLKALGFSNVSYESAQETAERVTLLNVLGKDASGKRFQASALEAVRRGKDSAWSSLTLNDYGDGEVASNLVRFFEVPWSDATAINDILLEGVTSRGRRLSYAAERLHFTWKPSGFDLHARGLRVETPAGDGLPLSFPIKLDVQATTSAGGVLKLEHFSAVSEAFEAKGTLTLAAPGLQISEWGNARAALAMDWFDRATLLDLNASMDMRHPFPSLGLPEDGGASRQGQGLTLVVRSTGTPLQSEALIQAWKSWGRDAALAVTIASTRPK